MMFWDMRLRLITQCDRGVFPHVCVVHCLFVVVSLSACVYRLLRFALLLRTRHSTHICLPTIPQKQTNKKNKNKNNVVYGHTLFVLIASKRVTTRHHKSGLRGLNELCEKRREEVTILFCLYEKPVLIMKETGKFSKQLWDKVWNLSFKYITTIYTLKKKVYED